MEKNYDAFNEYAMTFDMNIEMIKYKFNHSYRVVHQAEMIAHDENLSEEDMYLASLIALLHDYARFEQWSKYETFNDAKSFDHGDYAAKLLFDEGHIKKFDLKEEDYHIVRVAIENHNKVAISSDVTDERELLHCKIIRDADKLDILYAFSTNRLLQINDDAETPITEEIGEEYFQYMQVLRSKINSVNDKIILDFGLVFDLYFDYSKRRVLDEEYLTKIYSYLKNKDIFRKYYDFAIEYLKGEVEDNDREEI